MVKIKGRHYKRVAKKADGGCPKGARRFRRGKTSRTGCYVAVAKAKKRGKGKR